MSGEFLPSLPMMNDLPSGSIAMVSPCSTSGTDSRSTSDQVSGSNTCTAIPRADQRLRAVRREGAVRGVHGSRLARSVARLSPFLDSFFGREYSVPALLLLLAGQELLAGLRVHQEGLDVDGATLVARPGSACAVTEWSPGPGSGNAYSAASSRSSSLSPRSASHIRPVAVDGDRLGVLDVSPADAGGADDVAGGDLDRVHDRVVAGVVDRVREVLVLRADRRGRSTPRCAGR